MTNRTKQNTPLLEVRTIVDQRGYLGGTRTSVPSARHHSFPLAPPDGGRVEEAAKEPRCSLCEGHTAKTQTSTYG